MIDKLRLLLQPEVDTGLKLAAVATFFAKAFESNQLNYLRSAYFAAKYFAAQYLAGSSGATLKYWNGSSWVTKPLKYWNGSSWQTKSLKYWDGVSWA